MANVQKETFLGQVVKNEGCANSSLDKLAQLGKRARRKYVQKPIIEKLIEFSATKRGGNAQKLHLQFCRVAECSNEVRSDGNKVTAKYCNSRACLVCSAIRTGKLWNKYESSLKALKEPFFVTLTQGPRVFAMELEKTIANMTKQFQDCIGVLKKRKKNLVGFRKLEVAFTTKGKHKNTYHPHFHCLVDGEEQAYWLVSEWLKRNPNASPKAQDVRSWQEGDLNEVFKYITKFFDDDKKPIPVSAMYNIVVAMDKKRSFQTFGNFAKGTQEADNVNEGLQAQSCYVKQGTYVWIHDNWYSNSNGTIMPLMENQTTQNMIEHTNNLKQCLNVKTVG